MHFFHFEEVDYHHTVTIIDDIIIIKLISNLTVTSEKRNRMNIQYAVLVYASNIHTCNGYTQNAY